MIEKEYLHGPSTILAIISKKQSKNFLQKNKNYTSINEEEESHDFFLISELNTYGRSRGLDHLGHTSLPNPFGSRPGAVEQPSYTIH